MNTLNHFQVKIYATEEASVSMDEAISVFHRWIQQDAVPDTLLLDVVDYAHVPAGPGIILMGHEEYYALEEGAEKRLGLFFSSKIARKEGSSERLAEAIERARRAAERLASEKEWEGKLSFASRELSIRINDRLLAPNTKATFEATRPVLEAGIQAALGSDAFQMTYESRDPRELFCVRVKLDSPLL